MENFATVFGIAQIVCALILGWRIGARGGRGFLSDRKWDWKRDVCAILAIGLIGSVAVISLPVDLICHGIRNDKKIKIVKKDDGDTGVYWEELK